MLMMKIKVTFLIILGIMMSNLTFSQCPLLEELDVISLTTNSAVLKVEGLTNVSLSSPTQGVCGVQVKFKHDHVGEMRLELTSPLGQKVQFTGSQGSFGVTNLTTWDVLFLPCGNNVSPDLGFLDTWENNQNWGILGNYSGSYHPYLGCLEDFNAGPANGDWTISVNDNVMFADGIIEEFTIFFCDANGLDCNPCEAEGGELPNDTISTCILESDQIDIQPSYPNGSPGSDFEYYYLIAKNDLVVSVIDEPVWTSFSGGNYSVCGFSVLDIDIPNLPNPNISIANYWNEMEENDICFDPSDNCVDLIIYPEKDTIVIDTSICVSDTLVFNGEIYTSEGVFFDEDLFANECPQIYQINLDVIELDINFSTNPNQLSCSQNEVLLSANAISVEGTEFIWSTPNGNIFEDNGQEIVVTQPGIYTLELINNGCVFTESIMVTSNVDFPSLTIESDSLECNSSVEIQLTCSNQIDNVTWTGPNNYIANIENPIITLPGTYLVVVEDTDGCISKAKHTVNTKFINTDITLQADPISCYQPTVSISVNAENPYSFYWEGPDGFTSYSISPLVSLPGNYTMYATDLLGCVYTDNIEVIEITEPFAYELEVPIITCPNDNVVISFTALNGNPIVDWNINGNIIENKESISTNKPGIHIVTATLEGCVVTDTFEIVEDFTLVPEFEPTQDNIVTCDNPQTTLFSNIYNNADQVDTLIWQGPNSFIASSINVVVSDPGTYTLTVVTKNGCRQKKSLDLEFEVSYPLANISKQDINCYFEYGEINVNVNSDVDFIQIIGPGGFGSMEFTNDSLLSGEYIVSVKDSQNCTADYIVTIKVDTIPNNVKFITDNVLDCDTDTINLQANGKIDEYNWIFENDTISKSKKFEIYNPGFYYFYGIGSDGCEISDSTEIEVDDQVPSVNTTDQMITCNQEEVPLMVSSNLQITHFLWSGPNNFTSVVNQPITNVNGTYNVTVTGYNGCTNSGSLEVFIDTLQPDISASLETPLDCSTFETDLIGFSQSDSILYYNWIGDNNFISNDSLITVSDTGYYQFIVTNYNGCQNDTSIYVSNVGDYSIIEAIGDSITCSDTNPEISVNSSINSVDYQWEGPNSFASQDQSPIISDPGEYTVTVTTSEGCESFDTTIVLIYNSDPDLQQVNNADTLNCQVLSTILSFDSDIPIKAFEWLGPNGSNVDDFDLTVNQGGTYTLEAVGINDCISSVTVEVIQDTATVSANTSSSIIDCNTLSSDLFYTSQDDVMDITWIYNNSEISTDSITTVIDTGIYTLILTAPNFCKSIFTEHVLGDLEKPIFEVANDTVNCDYNDIILDVTSTTDSVTYFWTGPDSFESEEQNPITNVPGDYFIEVTGANGCSDLKQVVIFDLNYYPEINIDKSSNLDCLNDTVILNADPPINNEVAFWIDSEGDEIFQSEISVFGAGINYYTLISPTGCESIDSVEVIYDTLSPTIQLNQEGYILCDLYDVSINNFGSDTDDYINFEWEAIEGTIYNGANSSTPSISGEGIYVYNTENTQNGCTNQDTIKVEKSESTLESMEVTSISPNCTKDNRGKIIIDQINGGIPPYQYSFLGYPSQTDPLFPELTEGIYYIEVVDSAGCTIIDTVQLENNDPFIVELDEDKYVNLGDSVQINSFVSIGDDQIDSLWWEPDNVPCQSCFEYMYTPTENTLISLFVRDTSGCINFDEQILYINDDIKFFIPNIFSPNGDGTNDEFFIPESPSVKIVDYFAIQDRWGTLVHEDKAFIPGNGLIWDGTFKGRNVQQGVYNYKIKFRLWNDQIVVDYGTITVIR